MQQRLFGMQCPFFLWFRAAPSRRPQDWRDLSRVWVLLCLLPMLWMSVSSSAPHSHEARVLAGVFRSDSSQYAASAIGSAQSVNDDSEGAHQVLASHLGGGHNPNCLLCVWTSVAGACLMFALAFSLWPPLLRALPRALVSSLCLFSLPRSLCARAPPL